MVILLLTFSYIFVLPFACLFYVFTSWSARTAKVTHRVVSVFDRRFCLFSFNASSNNPASNFSAIPSPMPSSLSWLSYPVYSLLMNSKTGSWQGCPWTIRTSSTHWICRSACVNRLILTVARPSRCKLIWFSDRIRRPGSTWPSRSSLLVRRVMRGWKESFHLLSLGFLWHEIKQAYGDGLKDYVLSWNNIVDSSMNILYLSSFALKYYVFFEVSRSCSTGKRRVRLKPMQPDSI